MDGVSSSRIELCESIVLSMEESADAIGVGGIAKLLVGSVSTCSLSLLSEKSNEIKSTPEKFII